MLFLDSLRLFRLQDVKFLRSLLARWKSFSPSLTERAVDQLVADDLPSLDVLSRAALVLKL